MKIMDFMWNSISGGIPKEVGNITALELMSLDNNNLDGSVPSIIWQNGFPEQYSHQSIKSSFTPS
nr:unnamed protein product [Digitaria exilis]